MDRTEYKAILDEMYHISGVEATGTANMLLLAEFDRLSKIISETVEIARDFATRWYEEGDVYKSRNDAYGDFEYSYCRARGDSCLAVANAIVQKIYLHPASSVDEEGEA